MQSDYQTVCSLLPKQKQQQSNKQKSSSKTREQTEKGNQMTDDSPEIPDKRSTSDIPGLPSRARM